MADVKTLFDLAKQAMDNAYAPYSNFHVGACIETVNGTLYGGCNVENAAYGLTVCAEACAIVKMVSEGHQQIKQIAVIINGPEVAMPCGACRQRINEFADTDTVVHIGNTQGAQQQLTMAELLPYAFGKHDLIK